MIDLKAKPFFLDDNDINWVTNTLNSMTLEEKIGQLFCLTGKDLDTVHLEQMLKTYKPGGYMNRPNDKNKIKNFHKKLQELSKIPMLIAANLESGGNGIAHGGTYFGTQMQTAATDSSLFAHHLGVICGREGGAVGCNWSFSPIVDIDYNWRNPITNVRTFGSDVDNVIDCASQYMDGINESASKMAVCIKHFPGDGVDERDQHLLPTVNSLTVEEWENTYKKVYTNLIEKGAQTIMVGHIIQPEMTKKYCPDIKDNEILPGSCNKYLINNLLRQDMNFNGLIITDATPMVGYSALLTRKQALQHSIMAGIDMILFCKNIEEDYNAIREGVEQKIVSVDRINEAVTRILAMKANLKLNENANYNSDKFNLDIIGNDEHISWAKQCANKAITLVKDIQNLLPLSPAKTKKIRLTVLGENESGAFGDSDKISNKLKNALENAGFNVSLFDYETLEKDEIFVDGVEDLKKKFDLSIVAANVATGSNNTTRRIDWVKFMAANEPWYMKDIPTMFISFANPYHMIDVPFISTFINCYSSNDYSINECVDKITGNGEFTGKSPVDVWCDDVWCAKLM